MPTKNAIARALFGTLVHAPMSEAELLQQLVKYADDKRKVTASEAKMNENGYTTELPPEPSPHDEIKVTTTPARKKARTILGASADSAVETTVNVWARLANMGRVKAVYEHVCGEDAPAGAGKDALVAIVARRMVASADKRAADYDLVAAFDAVADAAGRAHHGGGAAAEPGRVCQRVAPHGASGRP
jgi:hypothetical protein